MAKKLVSVLGAMFILLQVGVCQAGLRDYPTIAVLQFANKSAVATDDKAMFTLENGALVSDFVIDKLMESDRFMVIEREELARLLSEYQLSGTGLLNPDTAVAAGGLHGVEYLVAGSVTGLSIKETGAKYKNSTYGSVGGNKHTVIANVNLRIIETATGRIVLTGVGKGESSSANVEVTFKQRKTVQTQNSTGSYENSYDTSYDTSYADSYGESDDSYYEDSVDTSSEDYYEDSADTSYEDSYEDSYSSSGDTYYSTGSTTTVKTTKHTLSIGATEVSLVQVHNALLKAAHNAIYGKTGILNKLEGGYKSKYKIGKDI